MKILKNNFRIMFIGVLLCLIFYACTKNENNILNEENTKNVDIKSNLSSRATLGTCCYINGSTLTAQTIENLCSPNAQAIVSAGTTTTYQYVNNTGNASNIIWSINTNPLNSATIISNGLTVTVTYLSNFISGTLSANGSGGTAQTCSSILNISKLAGTGGTGAVCDCPNPVIECVIAVSGGHPYWRFNINNLKAGETYTLSQINAPIFGGLNWNVTANGSAYVIINPNAPAGTSFTLFCEVTRVCSNGTIKKRKAYYRNEFGGNKYGGTSGFVNIGGSCDSPILGGGSTLPLGNE